MGTYIQEFIIFDVIIAVIDILYLYYWCTVLHAWLSNHIDNTPVASEQIEKALLSAHTYQKPYNFIVQITTKGGVARVVARGIDNVLLSVEKFSALKSVLSVEVISEDKTDIEFLKNKYKDAPIPVSIYQLPSHYTTPNNSALKMRALQYMVELHRKNPNKNAYIVHYDEESVLTPDNVARLVINLLKNPVELSEGSISYGYDWKQANILCRAMESNRPFGCHECYLVMKSPPAYHLHGSNLVVSQKLENEIGWDFGTYKQSPMVAEDLVFGLQAYLHHGDKIFGWHNVEMIEQPPFTLKAAVKQRERWVFGALQAVSYMRKLPEWKKLTLKQRLNIAGVIYMRVLSFALGFPISLISTVVNFFLFYSLFNFIVFRQNLPFATVITYILLPGIFLWLGAVQFGLYHNLRYAGLSRWGKTKEHLLVLVITPLSSITETYGAFLALVKWMSGVRTLAWVPTPKQYCAGVDEHLATATELAVEKSYILNE